MVWGHIKYHIAGNFHKVQTFAVFTGDPTIAKVKTVKVLTAQLVTSYGGVVYHGWGYGTALLMLCTS